MFVSPFPRDIVGVQRVHDLLGQVEGLRLSTNAANPSRVSVVKAGFSGGGYRRSVASTEGMVSGSFGPLPRGSTSVPRLGVLPLAWLVDIDPWTVSISPLTVISTRTFQA